MRESVIEKAVCDYVKTKAGIAYKFTSPQRRSVPDRIVILPYGNIFFIEFKATGEKPTMGQQREHDRLRALGQRVYIVDDIEEGKYVIDRELLQGERNWKIMKGLPREK